MMHTILKSFVGDLKSALMPSWTGAKKTVAALLAGTLMYTTLASPLVEAGFWQDRQNAAKSRNSNGTQYAMLPAGAGAVTDALPFLDGKNQSGVDLESLSGSSLPAVHSSLSPEQQKLLPAWLNHISSAHGTISQAYFAPNAADRPLIVHIQDVHEQREAQMNISGLINELVGTGAVSLVGLEGATGAFDLTPYRTFPNKAVIGDVADFMVQEHMIGGGEHAGWTAEKDPTLWGVEEVGIYLKNLNSFKEALPVQQRVQDRIKSWEYRLAQVKPKVFSPELKAFDDSQARYKSGTLALPEYVDLLEKTVKLDATKFPATVAFRHCLSLEKALNFSDVEKERTRLIESLTKALSEKEIAALVQRTLLYKSGRLSYGGYYDSLQTICEAKGVSLSRFPAMAAYIKYVLASEQIKPEALLSELDTLQENAATALVRTPDERAIYDLAQDLHSLTNLAAFKMAPHDWATYQQARSRIMDMAARMDRLAPGADNYAGDLPKDLIPFEGFCQAALARDRTLTDNLLAKMKASGQKNAILLTGGFHTEGMTDLLRKEKVSYVVFTPTLTEVSSDSNYLDFLKNRPALEKLFTQEKITTKAPIVGSVVEQTPGYNGDGVKTVAEAVITVEMGGQVTKAVEEISPAVVTPAPSVAGATVYTVSGPKNVSVAVSEGQTPPVASKLGQLVASFSGKVKSFSIYVKENKIVSLISPTVLMAKLSEFFIKSKGDKGNDGKLVAQAPRNRNFLKMGQLAVSLAVVAGVSLSLFGVSLAALGSFLGFGLLGVLLHELGGHLLVYNRLGGKGGQLLFGKDGVWVQTGDLGFRKNAWVAIAGPAANILMAALAGLLIWAGVDSSALQAFAYTNFVFGVTALLPFGKGSDIQQFASFWAKANKVDALSKRPIVLTAKTNQMAWGSEVWTDSTHPAGMAQVSDISLGDLVKNKPEVLGRMARLIFGDQLPIFTKFLRTNFDPLVHMGFKVGVDRQKYEQFLQEEQMLLGKLREQVRPKNQEEFDQFNSAYATWAQAQALKQWLIRDWDDPANSVFLAVLEKMGLNPSVMQSILNDLRANRLKLVGPLNEINLNDEVGNLLLSFAGMAHAIFGLSHQTHPLDPAVDSLMKLFTDMSSIIDAGRVAGKSEETIEIEIEQAIKKSGVIELRNSRKADPKSEAWLVAVMDGLVTLVEPQQTSATTYSFADLYTPFVFKDGEMVFRKGNPRIGLTNSEISTYLDSVDFKATPVNNLRKKPQEVERNATNAVLHRLVDDGKTWPFFTAYRLDLNGNPSNSAEWVGQHPKGAYQQLIVIKGTVKIRDDLGEPQTISPNPNAKGEVQAAALIPATMQGSYTLEASEDAQVLILSVPVPSESKVAPIAMGGMSWQAKEEKANEIVSRLRALPVDAQTAPREVRRIIDVLFTLQQDGMLGDIQDIADQVDHALYSNRDDQIRRFFSRAFNARYTKERYTPSATLQFAPGGMSMEGKTAKARELIDSLEQSNGDRDKISKVAKDLLQLDPSDGYEIYQNMIISLRIIAERNQVLATTVATFLNLLETSLTGARERGFNVTQMRGFAAEFSQMAENNRFSMGGIAVEQKQEIANSVYRELIGYENLSRENLRAKINSVLSRRLNRYIEPTGGEVRDILEEIERLFNQDKRYPNVSIEFQHFGVVWLGLKTRKFQSSPNIDLLFSGTTHGGIVKDLNRQILAVNNNQLSSDDLRTSLRSYLDLIQTAISQATRKPITTNPNNNLLSIQTMVMDALFILDLVDRKVAGATTLRLTEKQSNRLQAATRYDSFIDKTTISAVPVVLDENEPGAYNRGLETPMKMRGNLMNADGQTPPHLDAYVLYTMRHGFVPVPKGLMRSTQARGGQISTFHHTLFAMPHVPGSKIAASTGVGHYQGTKLDVKQVTRGEVLQVNVKYDAQGNVVDVLTQRAKVGEYAVALPGYFDYIVSIGNEPVEFDDISMDLKELGFSPAEIAKFQGGQQPTQAPSKAPYVWVNGQLQPAEGMPTTLPNPRNIGAIRSDEGLSLMGVYKGLNVQSLETIARSFVDQAAVLVSGKLNYPTFGNNGLGGRAASISMGGLDMNGKEQKAKELLRMLRDSKDSSRHSTVAAALNQLDPGDGLEILESILISLRNIHFADDARNLLLALNRLSARSPNSVFTAEGVRPLLIRAGRKLIVDKGMELTLKDYQVQIGVSESEARVQLDFLASMDRETEGGALFGVDKVPGESGDVYRRVVVDNKILGAYDMRGRADTYLTDKANFYIGMGYGSLLVKNGWDGGFNATASHNPPDENGWKPSTRARRGERSVAVVGGSVRLSTPRVKAAFIQGLRASGVDVYDIGTMTTSSMYHSLAVFQGPETLLRRILRAVQHWLGWIPGVDFLIVRIRGTDNYIKPLSGEYSQEAYALMPHNDSQKKSRSIDEIQKEVATRRVGSSARGSYTPVEGAKDSDLAAMQNKGRFDVDNIFVASHNTWVETTVRLGSEIQGLLFDRWVKEKDDFHGLIVALQGIEWPTGQDPKAWGKIVRALDLPRNTDQPESAVAKPLAGREIVIDFANGSGGRLLQAVENLGASVTLFEQENNGKKINTAVPDGRFPAHKPDPSKLDQIAGIIKYTKENPKAVGLAFDEDQDRLGIIVNGEVISGADAAALFAPYMEGPVLTDVRYWQYVKDAIENAGGTAYTLKVGYAFYIDAALKIQEAIDNGTPQITLYPQDQKPIVINIADLKGKYVSMGIEPSGHAFFRSNGYANDAAFFSGMLLSIVRKLEANHVSVSVDQQGNVDVGGETGAGISLATAFHSLKTNPHSPAELRVEMTPFVSPAVREQMVQAVLGFIGSDQGNRLLSIAFNNDAVSAEIDTRDGGKLYVRDHNGDYVASALIRKSNNEAVYGINFEGRDSAALHAVENYVVAVIAQTQVNAGGQLVSASFAGQHTSPYLTRETPQNQVVGEDGVIRPGIPAVERVSKDERLKGLLDPSAYGRLTSALPQPYSVIRKLAVAVVGVGVALAGIASGILFAWVLLPVVFFYGVVAVAASVSLLGLNGNEIGDVAQLANGFRLFSYQATENAESGTVSLTIGGKNVTVQFGTPSHGWLGGRDRWAETSITDNNSATITVRPGTPAWLLPIVLGQEIYRVDKFQGALASARLLPGLRRSSVTTRGPPVVSAEADLPVDMDIVYPVIMSGGDSTRLFPVDKVLTPNLDASGHGRSLMRQMFERLTSDHEHGEFLPFSRFIMLTAARIAGTVKDQLPEVSDENLLSDPAKRNTFPAILWAVAHVKVRANNPKTTLTVFGADQVVGDTPEFRRVVKETARVAQNAKSVVAIGIKPSGNPVQWTNYGAIKAPNLAGVGRESRGMDRFVEKPNEGKAKEMIEEGGHYWNAGWFTFTIEALEEAMATNQPEMFATYNEMVGAISRGDTQGAKTAFEKFPSKIRQKGTGAEVDNSMDYAIMEYLGQDTPVKGVVVPGGFPWIDAGNWGDVRQVLPANQDGNVIRGTVNVSETKNSTLFAESGMTIEAIGLEGIAVAVSATGNVIVTEEVKGGKVKPAVEPAKKEVAKSIDDPTRVNVVQKESENVSVDNQGPGVVAVYGVKNLDITVTKDRVVVRKKATGSPTAAVAENKGTLKVSQPVPDVVSLPVAAKVESFAMEAKKEVDVRSVSLSGLMVSLMDNPAPGEKAVDLGDDWLAMTPRRMIAWLGYATPDERRAGLGVLRADPAKAEAVLGVVLMDAATAHANGRSYKSGKEIDDFAMHQEMQDLARLGFWLGLNIDQAQEAIDRTYNAQRTLVDEAKGERKTKNENDPKRDLQTVDRPGVTWWQSIRQKVVAWALDLRRMVLGRNIPRKDFRIYVLPIVSGPNGAEWQSGLDQGTRDNLVKELNRQTKVDEKDSRKEGGIRVVFALDGSLSRKDIAEFITNEEQRLKLTPAILHIAGNEDSRGIHGDDGTINVPALIKYLAENQKVTNEIMSVSDFLMRYTPVIYANEVSALDFGDYKNIVKVMLILAGEIKPLDLDKYDDKVERYLKAQA